MVYISGVINFVCTAYPFLTRLYAETGIAVYDYFQVTRDTKIFSKFQVHFILSRVEYATKNNVKKFGINKLLDTGIYKAAFPLHDVSLVLVTKTYYEIEISTKSVGFISKDTNAICFTP